MNGRPVASLPFGGGVGVYLTGGDLLMIVGLALLSASGVAALLFGALAVDEFRRRRRRRRGPDRPEGGM